MDYQLTQQLQENTRLRQELEISKRAINTSEACDALIKWVMKGTDPLLPDWDENVNPNKWKGNPPGKSCCSVM